MFRLKAQVEDQGFSELRLDPASTGRAGFPALPDRIVTCAQVSGAGKADRDSG